jgi:hypothetical protein
LAWSAVMMRDDFRVRVIVTLAAEFQGGGGAV